MSACKIPPGLFDVVPQSDREPWRSSYLWQYAEEVIRQTAQEFGYREIRTPLFERQELFQRSVGGSSDIVTKEMYSFEDRGGRLLALRPEGTAPVMRAFVENSLQNLGSLHKLFYIGPMFRYERSQAGRYRQHHQFGVEAIGSSSPEQDVEVISLICTVFERLGLQNLKVALNCLGDKESRKEYRKALKKYLKAHLDSLSEESRRRFEANPLRILDSKSPQDRKILEEAPMILDYLSEEAKVRFQKVQQLLDLIDLPYSVNPRLVRGLDYYNSTVFEVASGELGAQNSVVGGGRYDGLLKELGGPDLPAIGFGCGMERLLQTMLGQLVALPRPPHPSLYLIPIGEKAKTACFSLLNILRQSGVAAQMEFGERKLSKAMQHANQIRARYVAVVGDAELESGSVRLKQMESGEELPLSLKALPKIFRLSQNKGLYSDLLEEFSEPFSNEEEKEFFLKELASDIGETSKAMGNVKNALIKIRQFIEAEK